MKTCLATITVAALACGHGFSAIEAGSAREQENPYPSRKQIEIILSPGAAMADRVEATHRLDHDLRPSGINALCVFLKSHEAEQDIAALHYLKNEVLNTLRNQSKAPEHLTQTMVAIYRDRQQDETMRDYAIQHLAAWYEDGAGDAPEAKQEIRGILLQAAQEKTVLGATALLDVHQLSQIDPSSFDLAEIDKLALQMAVTSDTSDAARATAFQVCAERQVVGATPAIEFAVRNSTDAILRSSAIAALRTLQDVPQTAVSPNSQIRQQVSSNISPVKGTGTARTTITE